MEKFDQFKKELEALLRERLGVLTEDDQIRLTKQARELGLDSWQFGRLLQEIDASINWNALRDEREGSDRVVRPIHIFETEVKSLAKLGQVLFDNPKKALIYLSDNIFLKENATYLSHQNVDFTINLIDLHASERNPERRFLKICYRLNPSLPFNVAGESFSTVKDLVDRGWTSHDIFEEVLNKFGDGHLQIWIDECFRDQFGELPSGRSYLDFLRFLYGIDPHYPFYLDELLFLDPSALVVAVKKDAKLWMPLLQAADDKSLDIWLSKPGLGSIMHTFEMLAAKVRTGQKKTEELSKSLVQKLLEILSPEVEVPTLSASLTKITFLEIQAKPLVQPITIFLANQGFVAVQLSLDEQLPGVKLSEEHFWLFDLEGKTSFTVYLTVDPAKLTKDKLNKLRLRVMTDYQSIQIEVSLRAVFPKRALFLCVLKYGFFGAVFLGVVRLLVGLANRSTAWLRPDLAWGNISAQLPDNHFAYIVILGLLILIPIVAWLKIKKLEQL